MALLAPAFAIPAEAQTEAASRTWGSFSRWLADLPLMLGLRMQAAADAVAASKVAAVAATSVAIAGGGVAIQQNQIHHRKASVQPVSVREAASAADSTAPVKAGEAPSVGLQVSGTRKPANPEAAAGSTRSTESAPRSARDEFDPLAGNASSSTQSGTASGASVPTPAEKPASKPSQYTAAQAPPAPQRAVPTPSQSGSKGPVKSSSTAVEFGP